MSSTAKPKDDEVDEIEADEAVLEDNEGETDELAQLQEKITALEGALTVAHDKELRAVADYQNLQRRTLEDRNKMARLASRTVIENMLQPLDHLFLAQAQLHDKGLDMVCQQFLQVLQDEGLEEIKVLGKKFDLEEMEVIDQVVVDDKKQIDKVIKVTQKGFRLNGEIIRHAKVVIGQAK